MVRVAVGGSHSGQIQPAQHYRAGGRGVYYLHRDEGNFSHDRGCGFSNRVQKRRLLRQIRDNQDCFHERGFLIRLNPERDCIG